MRQATLTISSKNYSSRSLRAWLLTRMSGLPFEALVTLIRRVERRLFPWAPEFRT